MFRRILLAVESGDAGLVATSLTVALARSSGGSVHVVHVNEYVTGGRGATVESQAEAVGVVAAAMAEIEEAGIPASGATYRTATFDVAAAIADLAAQFQADVIVLGSRRRRFGSVLRRSMRNRVARRTQLPVLLAPPPLKMARNGRALDRLPALAEAARRDGDRAGDRER